MILSLSGTAFTAPSPRPESVKGAGGTCSPPSLAVTSANKLKQGPYLVSGARSDANPGGGKRKHEQLLTRWLSCFQLQVKLRSRISGLLPLHTRSEVPSICLRT